jgi:hypothetical protein
VSQRELDHRGLPEFGRPPQLHRADVLVARVQIGPAVDEERGVIDITFPGEPVGLSAPWQDSDLGLNAACG